MRKTLMLLVIAAAPLLALDAPASQATAATAEQQQLLVKKKKEAARKEAEAKKAAEKKKAAEARKAREKKAAAAKKAEARRQAARDCRGFLNCLFGKPRAGVQRASTGGAARDVTTWEDVSWAPAAKYAPGSIVVRTPERALYLVTGEGEARRYKVGVGREGFQWSGNSRISGKAEWPTWRPPQNMIEREAAKGNILPAEMAGGPNNPLGARALYLGGTLYRIHGTNNAASIGGAVSSGCIRMMNADVIDLYERVKVGARVYVYQ
ncbi:L,D-transpeptidase [Aestuariivirga sp.]|uniref:L,D-transpeptidase n=1 Tax=Aestuariivirga sp. TaxID=2650926 RepID=UPI00391D3A38